MKRCLCLVCVVCCILTGCALHFRVVQVAAIAAAGDTAGETSSSVVHAGTDAAGATTAAAAVEGAVPMQLSVNAEVR